MPIDYACGRSTTRPSASMWTGTGSRPRGELFRSDNHSFNPRPRMNNLHSSHS